MYHAMHHVVVIIDSKINLRDVPLAYIDTVTKFIPQYQGRHIW